VLDFSLQSVKEFLIRFLSVKRNRLFLSSGIASICLFSILPSSIEEILLNQSILAQYKREASQLTELQDEFSKVKIELDRSVELKSFISDLIPSQDQADKTLPIIFTNLLSSSNLSLVEIVPIGESSYVANDDDNFFEPDLPEDNYDDQYSMADDEPFAQDDGDFGYLSENEAMDPFPSGDMNSEADVSSEPTTSFVYYKITARGLPSDLHSFFDQLHSMKILSSIGRSSFDTEEFSLNSQAQSNLNSSALVTLIFTLKIATEASPLDLSSNIDDFSNELLPLDSSFDDSLSSDL